MDCEEFKQYIATYILSPEEMDYDLRKKFETHFIGCDACYEQIEIQEIILSVAKKELELSQTEIYLDKKKLDYNVSDGKITIEIDRPTNIKIIDQHKKKWDNTFASDDLYSYLKAASTKTKIEDEEKTFETDTLNIRLIKGEDFGTLIIKLKE